MLIYDLCDFTVFVIMFLVIIVSVSNINNKMVNAKTLNSVSIVFGIIKDSHMSALLNALRNL